MYSVVGAILAVSAAPLIIQQPFMVGMTYMIIGLTQLAMKTRYMSNSKLPKSSKNFMIFSFSLYFGSLAVFLKHSYFL